MKRYLLGLLVSVGALCGMAEYKPVSAYASQVYVGLVEYEQGNPGCSKDLIYTYLKSVAFNSVKAEASNMGYGWRRVLESSYQLAISQNPQHLAIIEALSKELRNLVMYRDAIYWSAVGCAYFSTLVSMVSIGCMLFYLRYDRRVLNHYRVNSVGGLFPRLD